MGPPGHLAIGFAAKALAPKAPLWSLLVVSEVLDLLCIGFIILGVEKMAASQIDFSHGIQTLIPGSTPWSHGLLMSIIWSVVFGVIAFLVFQDKCVSAVIGLVVFSHWLLDFIVHPLDLPLFLEGSPNIGLGLWTSGPGLIASIILEFALLSGGLVIYWVAVIKTAKRFQRSKNDK